MALIRAQVMETLAARGAYDPIVEALRDVEPTLRTKAVELLGRARDANADYRLVRALRHLDPDVRAAAFTHAVARKSTKLLLIALDDRDVRRRKASLELLVTERLPGFLEAMVRTGTDMPVATAELVARLGSPEDKFARALLRKRRTEAIPLLFERGIEDEHALDLLFELAPAEASSLARAQWGRLAPAARARAMDRLALDEPTLRAAAEEPHEIVRFTALRHLLHRNLEADWVDCVRRVAPGFAGWTEGDLVRAIRKVRGTDGILALAAAARGTFSLVRRAAAEALRSLGAVEELASLADSDDARVVREVALALGERCDRRAIFPLIQSRLLKMLTPYPEVRTLEFALGALRHRRGAVRLWAAEQLEGCDDPRAIEPLVALLDDASAELQFAAIKALAKFSAEDQVWRRLLGCLELGDLSVRQAAIEVLGAGRVLAAVPALIRFLGNCFLKRYVAAALRQIGDRKGYLAVLRRKRRDEMIAREREKIRHAQTG